jgi:hypothetical protein
MALKINTDYLKIVHDITREANLMYILGEEIFKNMGTISPEYAELCEEILKSSEKVSIDIEKLKSVVPTGR